MALRTSALAQATQYTYDALGRLKTVTHPDGRVTTYTYDAAGNRSQVTTSGTPPPPPPPPPLWVGVSPTSLSGAGWAVTDPAATTVTGGTPPYTYLWQLVSGTTDIKANSPAYSSCGFYWDGSWTSRPKSASWRCKVTDSVSVVAYSSNVSVYFDPQG